MTDEIQYDNNDYDLLCYDLKKIITQARQANATINITNIPSLNLLESAHRNKEVLHAYRQLETKLKKSIHNFGGQFNSLFEYIYEKYPNPQDLYFPCDPHFNDNGARLATSFTLKQESK